MPETLEQVQERNIEEKVLSRGAIAEIASIVKRERREDLVFAVLIIRSKTKTETVTIVEA